MDMGCSSWLPWAPGRVGERGWVLLKMFLQSHSGFSNCISPEATCVDSPSAGLVDCKQGLTPCPVTPFLRAPTPASTWRL